MNNVKLLGRLMKKPEITNENGEKCTYITLAIRRSLKNEEGVYETDIIDVKVLRPMCDSIAECCEKGYLVLVKGSLERLSSENSMLIIADTITFCNYHTDWL